MRQPGGRLRRGRGAVPAPVPCRLRRRGGSVDQPEIRPCPDPRPRAPLRHGGLQVADPRGRRAAPGPGGHRVTTYAEPLARPMRVVAAPRAVALAFVPTSSLRHYLPDFITVGETLPLHEYW